MHSLVRRYLRTGIGFLALGLGLRLWMMADRELRQQFPVSTGICQVAGLAVFFYTMWSRIRPLGSQAREAHGERF